MFNWLFRKLRPVDETAASDDKPTFSIHASQTAVTAVMVTMIGVEAVQIEEIIDVTTKRFGSKHKIVYITDSLDFMQFRNRGAIFEYMPSAFEQKLHAAEISWNAYLERRWRLLLSKWRPLHVISYGHNIDGYLAAAPRMVARGKA